MAQTMSPVSPPLSRRDAVKLLAAAPAVVALGAAPTLGHQPRSAAAQGTTTVRLYGPPASPLETELLQEQINNFQAQNPTIAVQYEPIPSEYPVRLQTDLAAGTAADVFYVDSVYAPDLMTRNVLLPIDDYMAQAGVSAGDFYPSLISAFQYGGATYGIPKDWSSLAMIYDQQAFTDAGIAAPPATWDELRTAAQTLLDATGTPPIVIPPDFARYIAFHYAGGARVLSEDNTAVAIDSPETRAALEFYYGLYRDGLATTPADVGANSSDVALGQRTGAIVFEGNWALAPFDRDFPDLNYGIAEIPAGPGGRATMAFTVSYSISAATQVADAAWTLVNYLTGPEGMASWTSSFGVMPSRPALADGYLQQYPERGPFLAGGEYAFPWQFGPGGQQFFQDATAVLQGLFAGQIEVEEAATQIVEAANNDIQLQAGTPAASPALATPAASPVATPSGA